MRVNANPLLKNLIKSMNCETFNIFPTTICVGEMSDHKNYKKNFSLNSSLNIEKEKKLLANIGLIIKKIRIQRGITRDILAIKSKRK